MVIVPVGGAEGASVRLFVEKPEVQTRLEQLGLSRDGLVRAVAAGGGGWNSTTAFHSSSAPGTYLYQETTAALRRLVVPLGWAYDEADGQARTFNLERGLAIVVQTGDEYTGLAGGREPTTRHPKGPATQRKVVANGQMELFQFATDGRPVLRSYTWVLLVAVEDNELRAELSLPDQMSEDSRPCGWLERILLPAQPLGGTPPADLGDSGDLGSDTDFDVAWRQ